nr:hypothetical protein [Tanacetum cinerariifolium]
MTLSFTDTHNMVAYLNKSVASEGFDQIIDFLNGSYIAYALTVNPTIYVSCMKQLWNNVAVKQSNDVTRLQALVDKKKVVVTEATIRDALHLDDAEDVDCLPNEEIFTALARMSYEKPSTKLTFYKAFFSSQWKFLIHTILRSMSAKRNSWNEFSSAMASAFWNTAVVKHTGDVTRLQALVDKKRIMITEEVVHEILQLNDAEGVVCLPNEEIFAGLARIGYEKPSTKLTFYKAFFLTQWKFFIHTILHSLSAKRTSWNEFSSAMASALICLSSGQRFNFSKYIFESLVRHVDSSSKFYMYPRFIQLIIQTNIADLSKHTTRYISPVLTQKVFANVRRVGKGFSGVETPLFETMLAVRDVAEDVEAQVPAQGDDVQEHAAEEVVTNVILPIPTSPSPSSPNDKAAQQLEIVKLKARVKKLEKISKVKSSKLRRLKKVGTSQRVESSDDVENVFNQGRMIVDQDEGIELVINQEKDTEVERRHADKQAEIYNINLDHSLKVLSMQEDDTEVQEAIEVVTTAKLMTEVVTAAATQVVAASTPIPAAKPKTFTINAATAVSTRRRKGVVIRDPEEDLPSDTPAELTKEEINKEHEETYKNIDWNAALDHVQSKEPQYIKRYYGIKKKPQTEAEARKNMISYLKNTEGYKMEFFKGKTYDDILPIFQARFDANMKFLFKSREEMEKEDEEIIKSINETPTQKAAKRSKLSKEAQEVDDLRKRLEIVQDEDDDVFVEA